MWFPAVWTVHSDRLESLNVALDELERLIAQIPELRHQLQVSAPGGPSGARSRRPRGRQALQAERRPAVSEAGKKSEILIQAATDTSCNVAMAGNLVQRPDGVSHPAYGVTIPFRPLVIGGSASWLYVGRVRSRAAAILPCRAAAQPPSCAASPLHRASRAAALVEVSLGASS